MVCIRSILYVYICWYHLHNREKRSLLPVHRHEHRWWFGQSRHIQQLLFLPARISPSALAKVSFLGRTRHFYFATFRSGIQISELVRPRVLSPVVSRVLRGPPEAGFQMERHANGTRWKCFCLRCIKQAFEDSVLGCKAPTPSQHGMTLHAPNIELWTCRSTL